MTGEIVLGLVVLGLILVAIFAPEDRATREHHERMAVLGGMIAGADQWLADHRRRHTDLDPAAPVIGVTPVASMNAPGVLATPGRATTDEELSHGQHHAV